MDGSKPDPSAIRRYLLGALDDEALQEQIEEQLVVDEKFADELQAAEDQLIEDHLDDELTQTERQQFEKFFLSTPQRRKRVQLVRGVLKLAPRPSPVPVTPPKTVTPPPVPLWKKLKPYFSSPWPALAGFAVIAMVAATSWFAFFRGPGADEVTASLNLAFKLQRPFKARVSGLDYAPVGTIRGGDSGKVDRRALDKAADLARDAALARETAETLRNEGRVFLLKGEFDRAIDSLEKAKSLTPQNAEIWNELGAAQLGQGDLLPQTDAKGSELRAKALVNFDKAIELDPKLLPAYFNRALCLQGMSLPDQAKQAWQEYLKRDETSPWATEVRQYLGQIQASQTPAKSGEEILRDFLNAYRANNEDEAYGIVSRNREMITGKLIPQRLVWLYLNSSGTEQQENLAALTYVGRLELERSGDPFVSQLARYYAATTTSQLEFLRTAQSSVRSGYQWSGDVKYQLALDSFHAASANFSRAGNTWEAWLCEYWQGYFLFRLGRINESVKSLQALAEFSKRENYKWLSAQANAWLGVDMLATNEYTKAINYNREARALSAQVFDLYLNQKATSQLAEVYRTLGDPVQAFNLFHQALETAKVPDASFRQKCRDLDATADMYIALKNYSAATAYKKESMALAEQLNDTTFLVTGYLGLGVIAGAQGKYDEANGFLEHGRQIATGFADVTLRQKSEAFIDLQSAQTQRQSGNCTQALRAYDRAVTFFDSHEFNAFSYAAHKGRLICYYETGNEGAFQAELPVILRQFHNFRKAISSEQNRNVFFDNEQTVYDIAVEVAYDRANYDLAFAYSEESRARSLVGMQESAIEVSQNDGLPEITLPADTSEPRTLTELQAGLPTSIQLVQFSALADKTLIWLIKRDTYRVVESDISYGQLQEKVIAYLELLPQIKDLHSLQGAILASDLYFHLLTPIESDLDPNKEICFIPDKVLFRLPFAALISPATGRYLIADHAIFTSPSASSFLLSTAQAAARAHLADENLLSVGNPSFNQRDFEGLVPLSDAKREAQGIAQLYTSKTLLVEGQATKESVLRNLRQSSVIHIAAHYLVNQTWPLRSGLVMAEPQNPHDPRDSILANYEFVGEKLSQTRLIVLSACQTGVERFYNGEGMIGAARSFLATGVPLVVASQWNADSAATADLMTAFHHHRKQDRVSTVEALRRAQLDLINSSKTDFSSPYYWAAFETIGGYAEF